MGPNALSSLADGLRTDTSPVVLSRENGTWSAATSRFAEEVRELAAALSAYGLPPNHGAAILGAGGWDGLRAALGVLTAGGTLVVLDPSIGDDALRRVLVSTGAVQAIAADERQLARILALRPELPALELVLLMAAAPSERKPAAMLVTAALQVGAARLRDDPGCLANLAADSADAPACLLVDRRGDSRDIERGRFLELTGQLGDALDLAGGVTVLIALPIAGIERLAAVLAAASRGASILLSDPSERPDAGLVEHGADAILLNVAGLERLHRAWIEDIEAQSWLARRITRWALRYGMDPAPVGWKLWLADMMALRRLRARLGGRASFLTVLSTARGGASPEVEAFFKGAGLSVRYLISEPGGAVAR
jgi:long-chain acyl-CoA synthetase